MPIDPIELEHARNRAARRVTVGLREIADEHIWARAMLLIADDDPETTDEQRLYVVMVAHSLLGELLRRHEIRELESI